MMLLPSSEAVSLPVSDCLNYTFSPLPFVKTSGEKYHPRVKNRLVFRGRIKHFSTCKRLRIKAFPGLDIPAIFLDKQKKSFYLYGKCKNVFLPENPSVGKTAPPPASYPAPSGQLPVGKAKAPNCF